MENKKCSKPPTRKGSNSSSCSVHLRSSQCLVHFCVCVTLIKSCESLQVDLYPFCSRLFIWWISFELLGCDQRKLHATLSAQEYPCSHWLDSTKTPVAVHETKVFPCFSRGFPSFSIQIYRFPVRSPPQQLLHKLQHFSARQHATRGICWSAGTGSIGGVGGLRGFSRDSGSEAGGIMAWKPWSHHRNPHHLEDVCVYWWLLIYNS